MAPGLMDSPNIVVIMTDQQRADHAAREGFPIDTTSFLDSLAAEGTWFDRAYTSYPLCVPARTSFLTGRFANSHGIRRNDTTATVRYESDLFDVMNEQGYATALCGKNHSYLDAGKADHWFSLGHHGGGEHRTDEEAACSEWLEDVNMAFSLNPNPYPPDANPVGRAVTDAIEWIDSLGNEPFFTWLSIPEPHPPYQAPEPYFSLFDPDDLPPVVTEADVREEKGFSYQMARKHAEHFLERTELPETDAEYDDVLPELRAIYCGMLRMVDDQVRRFVEFLEAEDLRDETLLVFISDHGDYVGEYGMMRKSGGVPEALTRIPLLFAGPGVEASAEPHSAHVSIVDLLPTLCEAVGASPPDGVQGRSLWPLLTRAAEPTDEFQSIYAETGYGGQKYNEDDDVDLAYGQYALSAARCMIRRDDWKLVFDSRGNGALYDLESDPSEIENRYADPAQTDLVRELLAELLTWRLRLEDELPLPEFHDE